MRVKKLRESDKRGGKEVLSRRGKAFRWTISILLILYTGIAIFVTVVTLLDSVKNRSDLLKSFIAIPSSVTFDAYKKVLFENDFIRYFGNSLLLTVGGTAGCILLSAMMAYGIARYEFKGKNLLSSYLLLGMMVPVQVTILPVFLMLKRMGLLNKLAGVLFLYIAGISMSCIVFQKFFKTLPRELEESARMDGCHDVKLFFRIIFPIAKPVIVTMALIKAIGCWNDFYMPMILLGKKNTTTLTLGIYRYVGQFTRYMSETMAAVVITLIPIVILYFAFSTQIMEGMTSGAVKG